MGKRTKRKPLKLPETPESEIQARAISMIRIKHPDVEIDVNPLAEVQLHFDHIGAKMKLLKTLKQRGFVKSRPDIKLDVGKDRRLAIEMKKPSKNPFREFRRTGEPWIVKGGFKIKGGGINDEKQHVLNQLAYLGRLHRNHGYEIYLLDNSDDVILAIEEGTGPFEKKSVLIDKEIVNVYTRKSIIPPRE